MVTSTLIDPVDLRAILKTYRKSFQDTSYISLSSNPNTNVWSCYNTLQVHPLIFNDTLIISLVVPPVHNTFHLQMHQIHSAPVLNSMLPKALFIHITNPYLVVNDDGQYCNHPVKMDIMKCLVSIEHYCSLSGGLYSLQGSTDCALPLYFNNDNAIRKYCHVTVKAITTNAIKLSHPNHYSVAVIHSSSIELGGHCYTDRKPVSCPLALVTIPEGCSIFTLDFIILAVNAFTSKVPTILWDINLIPLGIFLILHLTLN